MKLFPTRSLGSLAACSLILTSLLTAPPLARADDSAASDKSIAAVLQPFVDSHALAGAVTLVASKDKVLDLGAVG